MASFHSDGKSHPYQIRRFIFTLLLVGQVWLRFLLGKTYYRRVAEEMFKAGPAALIPVLMVSGCGGMIFTIQTARQLVQLDALNTVGGMFAIAFCRELAPIITACIVAGQVASAFAAELGAMKVNEQIDALHILKTNPIDYLVLPRVLACCSMMPILMVFALVCGIIGGTVAASLLYALPNNVFLESVRGFLVPNDLLGIGIKGILFGGTIASIGCGWGLTTQGGVKQVGESATAAVVISGIAIFIVNLLLSLLLFGELPTGKIS
jgi:phospholipid/cholesterol/gamma-HCH transport system permease protein